MCLLLSCHIEGIHNSGIGAVVAIMAVATLAITIFSSFDNDDSSFITEQQCQGSIWNAQIMAGLYTLCYVQVCTLEEPLPPQKI